MAGGCEFYVNVDGNTHACRNAEAGLQYHVRKDTLVMHTYRRRADGVWTVVVRSIFASSKKEVPGPPDLSGPDWVRAESAPSWAR